MTAVPSLAVHRLAILTTVATAVLIVVGGLVTNTGAALAVPDWPTTFGYNMFLYPWSRMAGGVLYEHSHRLLGALVGGLTLFLAAALRLTGQPRSLRRLGLAALALVCFQGLLGGLRVLLVEQGLALVHGSVAQAFFALTVTIAALTAPGSVAAPVPLPGREARVLVRLALAAVAALYLQIVLGALATHAGRVAVHVGGAVVATVAGGVAAGRVLARHRERPALARPAQALALLLLLQLALGLGAYVARFTGVPVLQGAAVALALPVTHRVTASLLLGAAVVLALRSWRQQQAGAARVPGRAPATMVPGPTAA